MDEIKNRGLIISDDLADGIRTIVIKKKAKVQHTLKKVMLSDVFNYLPHGMVIKDETGMGATTLELRSERPSIIVEPLKITASHKAEKEKVIYVGSPTVVHPIKLTNEKLKEILSVPEPNRKIVVVADSLIRLFHLMGEAFREYFLLIDETDSFQLDSNFRDSMSICIDVYKDHPATLRALVTATALDFSDPELKKETTTIIKYDIPQIRTIGLFHTNSVHGTAVDMIAETLSNYPDHKIMVAYNNVGGCFDMATHLVSVQSRPKEEIKILCSENNKANAGDFYIPLETDKLPGKINFFTSAYFTGFDLHESYHLIALSENRNPIFVLSDKRLKQVAGRCRSGLFSESVVFNIGPLGKSNYPTHKELIEAAEKEIQALGCISSNYLTNPYLEANINSVITLIIKNTGDRDAIFVRENIHKKKVVNFLSIDASIENYRVARELYQEHDQLFRLLKSQGHKVSYKDRPSITPVDENKRVSEAEKAVDIAEIIEEALGKGLNELGRALGGSELGPEERKVYETCLWFLDSLTTDSIRQILMPLIKRDSRQFNNLRKAAYFLTLDSSINYKNQVKRHLPLKSAYTREELMGKWQDIFSDSGIGYLIRKYNVNTIVQFTKLHFKTTTTKDRPAKTKIQRLNPKGFELTKSRMDQDHFSDIFN